MRPRTSLPETFSFTLPTGREITVTYTMTLGSRATRLDPPEDPEPATVEVVDAETGAKVDLTDAEDEAVLDAIFDHEQSREEDPANACEAGTCGHEYC